MSLNADAFDMLYCDSAGCRVNTFERGGGGGGDWSDRSYRGAGHCPGCGQPGKPVS